jgi:hypothetical protein
MKNIDKAKQIVDSNADTLSGWLQKARKVREIEPYVQQAYEQTLWQRDALHLVPNDAPDLNASAVGSLDNSKHVYERSLPLINDPSFQHTNPSSFNATVISGSSDIFRYISQNASNLQGEEKEKLNSQIGSYIVLQDKQNRVATVKFMLEKLDQRLVDEFELAEREFQHFKNSTAEIIAPAGALRNVLQHFKGQVFLRARNTPKETPNWTIMASRLVIIDFPSPEHSSLEKEEKTHGQLYGRLSDIFKGKLAATATDIENIFIEVTDHFFTVLSLIKI